MLQARHLERLPGHVAKYAGSLNVFGPVDLADFLAFFKSFREGVRKRFGPGVKFRPVTEVGPDARRLHLHYAMTADGVEVTKADIESAWQEACDGHRVRVIHGPMRDVVAWSRYMFKSGRKYHDPADPENCVVLFAKGSPRLPQATPGFFPSEAKAALWDEWKSEQEERKARPPERRQTFGKGSGKAQENSGKLRKSGGRDAIRGFMNGPVHKPEDGGRDGRRDPGFAPPVQMTEVPSSERPFRSKSEPRFRFEGPAARNALRATIYPTMSRTSLGGAPRGSARGP